MNIQSSVKPFRNPTQLAGSTKSGASSSVEPLREDGDSFEASDRSEFGARVMGGFMGALVGGIAGAAGSQSAALASGLGAGIATTVTLGPHLTQAVKSGLNGDTLNDVAVTTSAIFAGGVTLSAFSAAAGLGAFALDQALPGAGRIVGAAMGAAAGASLGIWN